MKSMFFSLLTVFSLGAFDVNAQSSNRIPLDELCLPDPAQAKWLATSLLDFSNLDGSGMLHSRYFGRCRAGSFGIQTFLQVSPEVAKLVKKEGYAEVRLRTVCMKRKALVNDLVKIFKSLNREDGLVMFTSRTIEGGCNSQSRYGLDITAHITQAR